MMLRRFAARDGLPLAALDWPGDRGRTPLLCLPGICRTAMDYEEFALRHRGHRRVVALDYPGHGESGRAAEVSRYTPQAVVGDILDACAALGLHRAVVVGTSFGGLMAMFLSLVRPTLLRGVVLNDIGPVVEPLGLERTRGFVGRDPAFARDEEAVAYLQQVMPGMPLRDAESWRRFATLTYRRGEDDRLHPRWDTRLAQVMEGGAPVADFGPVFAGLRDIPTLLIWGERSEFLSARTVQAMRAEKPDLGLIVLPDSGHAPTLGEPELAPRLDAFLERLA
ncbi:alpha/beta fold hydrolase [Roseomonas sp. BN140053]|uniref:alpha/beta fold hydrolase n=1 Tax=Roseomonas sp. BN140053 TaxID=3391898 RepID=UPI0039EB25F0